MIRFMKCFPVSDRIEKIGSFPGRNADPDLIFSSNTSASGEVTGEMTAESDFLILLL